MPRNVGFIGLGIMGRAMARRLVDAGHRVTVWNRDASKAAEFVAAGARQAATPRAAAEENDVVITMVTDDASLQTVTLGAGGIRESLAPGAIHISMGTHGVGVIQKLAAAHNDAKQILVGAPVLGRPVF